MPSLPVLPPAPEQEEQGNSGLTRGCFEARLLGEVLLRAEVWGLRFLLHAGVLVLAAEVWRGSGVLQEPGWEVAERGASSPKNLWVARREKGPR